MLSQVYVDQMTAKSEIHCERCELMAQITSTLREELPPSLFKAVDLATQLVG